MSSKVENIIIFTRYNRQSASVRYRYLQYFELLNQNNKNTELSYLFDENFFRKKIFLNRLSFFNILYSYIKRLIKIIFLKKNTIVIIHLELFPYFPYIGEKILSLKNIKLILDLDDAIFHQYENINNYFLSFLLKNKFQKIFQMNNLNIFSGNQ